MSIGGWGLGVGKEENQYDSDDEEEDENVDWEETEVRVLYLPPPLFTVSSEDAWLIGTMLTLIIFSTQAMKQLMIELSRGDNKSEWRMGRSLEGNKA